MARKKKKAPEAGEQPQEGKKRKKGKKKLLLIPIALLLVAAVAAAAILLILPRFGINLLGGGDDDNPEEPIPKKGVTAYTIGEDSIASLDTILAEGEGSLLALRSTPEQSKAEEEGRLTYIYELNGAAAIMNRYLDLLLGSEGGFSLVDETYLIQEERPELEDTKGALMVAKPSAVEGRVFQLAIGWAEDNNMLAIRLSVPEAQLRKPEKKEEAKPASLSEQLETIREMEPSQLALSGRTMAEYDIYPIEGFVTVDGILCRRFNIYETGQSGKLASIIFLSGDQQHLFRMDVGDNSIITELK